MLQLKDEAIDESGKPIGIVVGFISPQFWAHIGSLNLKWASFKNWNEKYPDWVHKPMVYIAYYEHQQQMTKQELANQYEIPVEYVTDKMYNAMVPFHEFICVPLDAVKTKAGDLT